MRWIDVARLWSKVNIPRCGRQEKLCWLWTGATAAGYGEMKIRGRPERAHTLALTFAKGVAPSPGMCACHACDNTLCCHPSHLYWGTHIMNMRDRVDRHPRYQAFRDAREARIAGLFVAGGGWRKGWKQVSPGVWMRPDGTLHRMLKTAATLGTGSDVRKQGKETAPMS